MEHNILPADTYVVINKTILTDYDRKLLTMLYQPIMGSMATNLYLTLWTHLDQGELTSLTLNHHYLISNMRLKLSDIMEAREKLEALGLICTYIKTDTVNNYIYELYSPLSAHDFFNNPILNTTLMNHLGIAEYKKIVNFFKLPKINLSEYENISCSFSDIFKVTSVEPMESTDIRKRNSMEVAIKTNLDIDNLLSKITDDILNKRSITTKMRELLYKLSFIYDYNEETLANIISNSLTANHTISVEELKSNCRNYYSFEHNGQIPNLIDHKQPDYLRKKDYRLTNKDKIIYQFETVSPHDFLYHKNHQVRPNKSECALLERLLIDYNLKPGVVNVLIDYVLRINNNKLTRNFVETIASQWKKTNVETVSGAMLLAEKEYKNKRTSKKTTKEKPTWLDQDIKADIASTKEVEEFKRKLKQV